jgi:hypothetical protein
MLNGRGEGLEPFGLVSVEANGRLRVRVSVSSLARFKRLDPGGAEYRHVPGNAGIQGWIEDLIGCSGH